MGSWVVTGEHRPYDKKVSYARRILPTGNWGSLELFGRCGGFLTKWFFGANWWVNRRIRLTAGYGRANPNQYFTRVQWTY